MKLDDFEAIFETQIIASNEEQTHNAFPFRLPPFIHAAVKDEMRQYVQNKLREFGERVKEELLNKSEIGNEDEAFIKFSELIAQIDKELKELV